MLSIWPDPQPHIDQVCHPLEKQPMNVNIDPETQTPARRVGATARVSELKREREREEWEGKSRKFWR